jgi:hypothetical protein
MRIFLFLITLLYSSGAFALCDDFAELHTKKWSINISDGGCGPQRMITFSRNGGESIEIPFNSECKEIDKRKDGAWHGFSCRTCGRSPMAGATYRLFKRGKPYCEPETPNEGRTPGYQYICIKGCKDTVPKFLIATHACD